MFNKKITIELNEKIIELRATINEKDAVIEKKNDLAKTLNQKNQNLLGQVKTVESQNQNLKAENQDLKNQNQNLVKELEVLEMKIKNMEKIHKKEIDKYVKREERYEDIISEAEIVVEDLEAKIFGLNLALDKKKDIKELEEEVKELQEEIENRIEEIEELDDEIKDRKLCMVELDGEILELKEEKANLSREIETLIVSVEEDKEMILVSNVFNNPYNYDTSAEYQTKLDEIKDRQKEMARNNEAIVCTTTWQIGNSKAEGKKFVKKMSQLMLRAFVNEADNIIMKAKYSNIDKCEENIRKSYEAVNKMSNIVNCSISETFLNLKLEELTLRFGWLEKKEEEKEELRKQQEILREQAKAEEEMNARREQIVVEREHYNNELARLRGLDSDEAVERIEEIEEILEELDKQEEEIEYRTFHNKAGYVYIISNPSFEGQEMYKIGVTRRLEPQVRVDELGSASLPFRFGVHSFIFSEDAFALEHSLHTAFDDRRVNKINKHKEFFYVTLDEIKAEVEKHNPTAEFIDEVVVEEYVRSLEMEN